MRAGIVVNVTRADRRRLEAIVADRSAPQKHVWRANIILATADGCGTAEIMRRSGKSKPVVWRWQERFMQGRRRGADARQDTQARDASAAARYRTACGRPCARSASRGSDPLDGPDAGEGGAGEPALGAAHPGGSPTRAPPVSAPSSCRTIPSSHTSSRTSSVSTSIRPPMRSSSRSTRRAKSRRSTAPSRVCR